MSDEDRIDPYDAGRVLKDKLDNERNAHHSRAREEFEDLDDKIKRLQAFIQGPGYYAIHDDAEKGLLSVQLQHMSAYRDALKARMEIHKGQM